MDPARLVALGKESLKVVLLSLGLALAFAAAAQRKGSELSVQAEWRQAAEGLLDGGLARWSAWQDNQEERQQLRQERARKQQLEVQRKQQEREERQERKESQKRQEFQKSLAAARQDPPAATGQPAGPSRANRRSPRGAADASYFEALAGEDDAPPG
jgi:hypothetical protein